MNIPLQNIHYHIKKHHKKYLLGTAIGGVGFFVIKILVFILGVLGLLQYS